jgi:hypothetical protein
MHSRTISLAAFCLLATCVSRAQAQAPFVSDVLTGRVRTAPVPDKGKGASGLQPGSSWLRVGAQMGYLLDGSGTIEDDFLASGRVEVGMLKFSSTQPEALKIPIISNIGSLGLAKTKDELEKGGRDLLASAKGLSIAVSPYRAYGPCRARTTLYASAGWKLNTGRDRADTTRTVKLHQGRFSVGIGIDAKIIEGSAMPVTFSVEPVYTVWNASRYRAIYGVERSALTSLELTAIIPIRGLGLLAQTNVAQAMTPAWRIGLLLFTPESKPNPQEEASKKSADTGTGDTPVVPATGTAPANPPAVPAATTTTCNATIS